MHANPILRLLQLLKMRWGYISLGALFSLSITSIVSLMSPYLYDSKAVVEIVLSEEEDSILEFAEMAAAASGKKKKRRGGSGKFRRAVVMIRSDRIIREVAAGLSETLSEENIPLAFPRRFSVIDIRQRLRLASEHFGRGRNTLRTISKIGRTKYSEKVLVSMLREHLRVDTDRMSRTIILRYTAASPEIARKIVNTIVTTYMARLSSKLSNKIRKQEEYFSKKVDEELVEFHRIEEKIRSIYEEFPDLAANASSKGAGIGSVYSSDYIRHRLKLQDLEFKLKSNNKILSEISKAIRSGKGLPQQVDKSITDTIVGAITALEFEKLNLVVLKKLPDNHKRIQKINRKLATLRKTLNGHLKRAPASEMKGTVNNKTLSELKSQYNQLIDQNNRYFVQSALVKDQIKNVREKMKEGIKLEFDLFGLKRRQDAVAERVRIFSRSLQMARLSLAQDAEQEVNLLVAPTQPLFPSNLSLRKKAFFGFIFGLALMATIIFLLDLNNPKLLIRQDLDGLKIRNLGSFNLSSASVSRMASHIYAFRQTSKRKSDKMVTVFASAAIDFNLNYWVDQVSKVVAKHGVKVALLTIGVKPSVSSLLRKESEQEAAAHFWVSPSEISFEYKKTLESLKERYDWVFVSAPGLYNLPGENLVISTANDVYHALRFGVTSIRDLVKVRQLSLSQFGVGHYCISFSHGGLA